MARADDDGSPLRLSRTAVVPPVSGPVLHDDVSGFEENLFAVEFEADRALEHDVKIEGRGTVRAWPAGFGELGERGADELIEVGGFAGRKLCD